MLWQTEASRLNPVTRCMGKQPCLRAVRCCVAQPIVVTSTSGAPGGNRNNNGEYNNIGNNGYWWSSSENDTNNAWNRNLNNNNGNANRNNNNKQNGFSVRCLRDLMETVAPGILLGAFLNTRYYAIGVLPFVRSCGAARGTV